MRLFLKYQVAMNNTQDNGKDSCNKPYSYCSHFGLIATMLYKNSIFLFFFLIKVHFVGPLIAHILDFVWPSSRVSKPGGSHTYMHTCLHPVNLWVTCGVTPAFSTNSGVHCISVYIAVTVTSITTGTSHCISPISLANEWDKLLLSL